MAEEVFGVSVATPIALLRALDAGDRAGVDALLEGANPVALLLAMGAVVNTWGRQQYGPAGWDAALIEHLRQMAGPG
jgi:hypothetical protein